MTFQLWGVNLKLKVCLCLINYLDFKLKKSTPVLHGGLARFNNSKPVVDAQYRGTIEYEWIIVALLLIIWLSTINGVTDNGGYKYGRKCLDHKDLILSTMIIREKNTEKERERDWLLRIASACEWVRGLLIVEARSWWLRNRSGRYG